MGLNRGNVAGYGCNRRDRCWPVKINARGHARRLETHLFSDRQLSENSRLVERRCDCDLTIQLISLARRAASIGIRCEEGTRVRRTRSPSRRNSPPQSIRLGDENLSLAEKGDWVDRTIPRIFRAIVGRFREGLLRFESNIPQTGIAEKNSSVIRPATPIGRLGGKIGRLSDDSALCLPQTVRDAAALTCPDKQAELNQFHEIAMGRILDHLQMLHAPAVGDLSGFRCAGDD